MTSHCLTWHNAATFRKRVALCALVLLKDYRFNGGTIDTTTLKGIDCPQCLVILDTFFVGGILELTP